MKIYEITEYKKPQLNEAILTEFLNFLMFALDPSELGDGTVHSWHLISRDNPEVYNGFIDALETGKFGTAVELYKKAGGKLDKQGIQTLSNDIASMAAKFGRNIDINSLFKTYKVDPGIAQSIAKHTQQAAEKVNSLKQAANNVPTVMQDPSAIPANISSLSVSGILDSLKQATNGAMSGPTAIKIANAVKQYALPAAAVIALLYGGKKLFDYYNSNKLKTATESKINKNSNLNEGPWDGLVKYGSKLLIGAGKAGAGAGRIASGATKIATGTGKAVSGAGQVVKDVGVGVGVGAGGMAAWNVGDAINSGTQAVIDGLGNAGDALETAGFNLTDIANTMVKYKIPHALAALALLYGSAKVVGAIRNALGYNNPQAKPATESATGMGTGSIATVSNPTVARSKKKAKSVSALDSNVSLFGGKTIKR